MRPNTVKLVGTMTVVVGLSLGLAGVAQADSLTGSSTDQQQSTTVDVTSNGEGTVVVSHNDQTNVTTDNSNPTAPTDNGVQVTPTDNHSDLSPIMSPDQGDQPTTPATVDSPPPGTVSEPPMPVWQPTAAVVEHVIRRDVIVPVTNIGPTATNPTTPSAAPSAPHPSAPSLPMTGLGQLTDLLARAVVPAGALVLAPMLILSQSHVVHLIGWALALTAMLLLVVTGFIATLRRSGFRHAARSDVDSWLHFASPLKVDFAWSQVLRPVAGPLFSGDKNKLMPLGRR